jgi:hypothetical protein
MERAKLEKRALCIIANQNAMPKWVNEEVLQKYSVDRHEKYSFKGQRITKSLDKYAVIWKTGIPEEMLRCPSAVT